MPQCHKKVNENISFPHLIDAGLTKAICCTKMAFSPEPITKLAVHPETPGKNVSKVL
jgi:hypothetical protein